MSVAFQIILFPAIISGILANFLAENLGLGPLAPFAMAVPCFLVCFFVVLMTWEENYGDSVSTVTQPAKSFQSKHGDCLRNLFFSIFQLLGIALNSFDSGLFVGV